VTVILLPENLTHTVNHVTTLTAQHTLSVASDSASCVNKAKSLHHIDVIVHGLTNPGQRVAMGQTTLEACNVDCFLFILSFLVFNFKLFFSMHFTTKGADSLLPPTSSLNTEISLALHENVWNCMLRLVWKTEKIRREVCNIEIPNKQLLEIH